MKRLLVRTKTAPASQLIATDEHAAEEAAQVPPAVEREREQHEQCQPQLPAARLARARLTSARGRQKPEQERKRVERHRTDLPCVSMWQLRSAAFNVLPPLTPLNPDTRRRDAAHRERSG